MMIRVDRIENGSVTITPLDWDGNALPYVIMMPGDTLTLHPWQL